MLLFIYLRMGGILRHITGTLVPGSSGSLVVPHDPPLVLDRLDRRVFPTIQSLMLIGPYLVLNDWLVVRPAPHLFVPWAVPHGPVRNTMPLLRFFRPERA
jgi:hypothetical protein